MEFVDEFAFPWQLEGDVMVEESECVVFVQEELEEVKLKKWNKARHLRSLYIKAHVYGKPMSRVLMNGGAVLNIMPFSIVKRLGNGKDLKETNITISNFTVRAH